MTLKQFAIEQVVKDLMPLESDFRRIADEDCSRHSLRCLSRELENVLSYAINPAAETGETLTAEWLEKTKSAINAAVRDAQDAVGLGDPLYSRLPTARSLGLQLARLLLDVTPAEPNESLAIPPTWKRATCKKLTAALEIDQKTLIKKLDAQEIKNCKISNQAYWINPDDLALTEVELADLFKTRRKVGKKSD